MANVLQKITEPCHAMDERSGATLGLSVAMLVISNTKKYQQVDNIEWYCPVCMKQNATIQRQEGHSIGSEAQTMESSLSPDAAFKFPKRGFSLFHLNTRSLFLTIDEIRLFANNNPFNVLAFSEHGFLNLFLTLKIVYKDIQTRLNVIVNMENMAVVV